MSICGQDQVKVGMSPCLCCWATPRPLRFAPRVVPLGVQAESTLDYVIHKGGSCLLLTPQPSVPSTGEQLNKQSLASLH